MKIPLSLIKAYLPINVEINIDTICNTLTLLGIEVDSVENAKPSFSKVIVGEVISVSPHPNAEKLQVAQVHNGKETVQVVCGAPNCRKGIKTAFAVVGASLLDQNDTYFTIKKAVLRGVESHGMLCSANELNLWKDSNGIMELPLDLPTGSDLAQYLWDPIFELSLTPNLGHAMSAQGIARELAAALNLKITKQNFNIQENPSSCVAEKIHVTIEDFAKTPKYMGRLIENVKIGPSPFWLQKILLSCGMKSINNVVDITNYILLKTGHPLHAFDFDLLQGKQLHVKTNNSSQKWTGLDNIEREIKTDVLTILDANEIVAIAGVMGGLNSAISENTQNIFLEAASFDPSIVRKGAKLSCLRTDSAIRFEKGVDPNGVESALNEATYLIAKEANGSIARGTINLQKKAFEPKKIPLRIKRVNAFLGTKLSQTEIENILLSLECLIHKEKEDLFLVTVPTYRFDIHEEVDLIEEIIRLYGYNNIEKAQAKCITSAIAHDPSYVFEKTIRMRCTSLGLQEFLTSDLIAPKTIEYAIEFLISKGIKTLKALHAKTEEYSVLRPSLLPGLLEVAKTNVDLKNLSFHAFEIGRIHYLQNEKCVETPMLGIIMSGKSSLSYFSQKAEDVNFYDLKGMIENILKGLCIEDYKIEQGQHVSFHPGRQANLVIHNHIVGSFGEIHPDLLQKVDIKQRVLYAEINLQDLMSLSSKGHRFHPIPNLPSSERDWTYSIDRSVQIGEVFEKIETYRPKILEKYELIDLYEKENTNTKNATLRFTYRDLIKTVSAEEVEQEHTQLIEKISNDKK